MNKEIRFAIIGCGRIANRHAEHINNIGKLVAVCDVVETKAKALALQYNAIAFTSIESLLQNTFIEVGTLLPHNNC